MMNHHEEGLEWETSATADGRLMHRREFLLGTAKIGLSFLAAGALPAAVLSAPRAKGG